MKLYFSKGACSLVVRIILHEIGLSATFEAVNLKTKTTAEKKDFYAINEKGAVPVLELDNKQILTENAVILQYLADSTKSYQLLPQIGNIDRYRILEWLNYITTELHKGFGPLFNPTIPQALKDEIFIPLLKAKFSFINKHLKKQNYLFGDHFTLPDAYLFVMLTWAVSFDIKLSEWHELNQYFTKLKARESIQISLKEEGLA